MRRAGIGQVLGLVLLVAAAAMSVLAQEPSEDQSQERPRVKSRDVLPEQEPPQDSSQEMQVPLPQRPERGSRVADGKRHSDLPEEAYAVVPGTKFLVRLEDELDTKQTHEKSRFKVVTLEPMEAGSGIYLPPGAEIRGHVSRVEPAGVTGRAKIWLTFDDIRTRFGTLPIVADVVSIPGDHSVRMGTTEKEGLIEGRTSTQESAAQAAAAGAVLGAAKGVRDKNKREIAEGASAAAIAAYLMESGRGHEIDLPKGAKLELELERPLYLLRD